MSKILLTAQVRCYNSMMNKLTWVRGLSLSFALIGLILYPIQPIMALGDQSSIAQERKYGITLGDVSNDSNNQLNSLFAGISKLGFGLIRIDFQWRDIQPSSSSSYSWFNQDRVVALAAQDHLQILGVLDFAPTWAVSDECHQTVDIECPPVSSKAFGNFASAVTEHYKNSVNWWEVWNEENTSDSWFPTPNAVQYTAMLQTAFIAIKLTDPNAVVIMGGMSDGIDTQNNISATTYLQEVYANGGGKFFDDVSYHPYTFPKTPLDTNTGWSEMNTGSPNLRSIMLSHNDGSKQIWVTEYGAPTNGPTPNTYVGQNRQAQMALYAYIELLNDKWAGPLFWATYQDSGTDTSSSKNFYGLVNSSGKPKVAYSIWHQILAH